MKRPLRSSTLANPKKRKVSLAKTRKLEVPYWGTLQPIGRAALGPIRGVLRKNLLV